MNLMFQQDIEKVQILRNILIQENIKGTQYSYPCNTAPKKYRLKQTNTIATACTVKGGK